MAVFTQTRERRKRKELGEKERRTEQNRFTNESNKPGERGRGTISIVLVATMKYYAPSKAGTDVPSQFAQSIEGCCCC